MLDGYWVSPCSRSWRMADNAGSGRWLALMLLPSDCGRRWRHLLRGQGVNTSAGRDSVGLLGGWSAWLPLRGAGRDRQMPAVPGLYRIRRQGDQALVYIGETGRQLRGRLGQLQGVFAVQMPYADPHTAAPALWAMRHREGCDFEASVLPLAADAQIRKGLEALAVSLYRVEAGQSPAANFGWMPLGYRKSTGNNAHLVAAGRRALGGADPGSAAAADSAPVHGALATRPDSDSWMNWPWTPWMRLHLARPPLGGAGLYRLRETDSADLAYVGQGNIGQRIRAHLAKPAIDGHRQGRWFSGPLDASWVELHAIAKTNMLEHETDLIASHVYVIGRPPQAQYLG
jgi:hypothetical protein